MEYCSLLWAGAPASHIAQFDTVETKAFKVIGISRDEAESMGLSLHHCRQVGGLILIPSTANWWCYMEVGFVLVIK